MNRIVLLLLLSIMILQAPLLLAVEINYVGSTPWPYFGDVKIRDHYAYCTSTLGLIIVDVIDPLIPVVSAQIYFPGAAQLEVENNLLFLARTNYGLDVLDISNPINPSVIGHLDSQLFPMKVCYADSFLYIADDSLGLVIIDANDPTHPAITASLDTPGRSKAVSVEDDYAYLIQNAPSSLQIINIEEESHPTLISTYSDSLYSPAAICIQASYAYIANYPSDFCIIDISNPESPMWVSRGWSILHTKDIAVSGEYAYVATDGLGFAIYNVQNAEQPSQVSWLDTQENMSQFDINYGRAYVAGGSDGFMIFDITNTGSPAIFSKYKISNNFHNIAVSANHVYAADRDSGISVIDISSPESPTVIARFDTLTETNVIFYSNNYLYTISGRSYSYFLNVFDISDPSLPALTGRLGVYYQNAIFEQGFVYLSNPLHPTAIIDVRNPSNPYVIGRCVIDSASIRNVEVAGNTAYLFGINMRHWIFDVSDKANPILIGDFYTSSSILDTYLDSDKIYASSENDSILIIDIENPDSPEQIGAVKIGFPPSFGGPGINKFGNFLFVYKPRQIVKIINVSNPTQPALLDSLNLQAEDIAFSGDNLYLSKQLLSIWHIQPTDINNNLDDLPGSFTLSQCFPNPFNSQVTIEYSLSKTSEVKLLVYDILGRKIESIEQGLMCAGIHKVSWDGANRPSGLYFYEIQADGSSEIKKMLLLK